MRHLTSITDLFKSQSLAAPPTVVLLKHRQEQQHAVGAQSISHDAMNFESRWATIPLLPRRYSITPPTLQYTDAWKTSTSDVAVNHDPPSYAAST